MGLTIGIISWMKQAQNILSQISPTKKMGGGAHFEAAARGWFFGYDAEKYSRRPCYIRHNSNQE